MCSFSFNFLFHLPICLQELVTLAQTKFLRQVSSYTNNLKPYPRLFLLDCCSKEETEKIATLNEEALENALIKEEGSLLKDSSEPCSDCQVGNYEHRCI